MKKGFTLVEILGVIIILGVIGLIVTPIVSSVIKNNKEGLYQAQLKEISESASKWAYNNLNILPTEENSHIFITLQDLKTGGFIPLDVRNPKTGELFDNSLKITITFENNNFTYFVDGESGNIDNGQTENSPILTLNGNVIEYVELGSIYQEMGATAHTKDGTVIEQITKQYKLNEKEVALIDTLKFNTYIVTYFASNIVNGQVYSSYILRTIIIRDTTPPILNIPGNIDITLQQAETFNILDGTSVIDNSGEIIEIKTTGYDKLFGKKIVTYSVVDSSGNKTEKKRIINILQN